jgi:hypothetical protein
MSHKVGKIIIELENSLFQYNTAKDREIEAWTRCNNPGSPFE